MTEEMRSFPPPAQAPGTFQNVQYGKAPQPGSTVVHWAPVPQNVPNCPPGLEYLSAVDGIMVNQQVEMVEAFTGFHVNNRYELLNRQGQRVYFAAEHTGFWWRLCCGPMREFAISILDNSGNRLCEIKRPFKCCAGCCWCACSNGCSFELTVEAPEGTLLGSVMQTQSFLAAHLDVLGADGEVVLKIRGPMCICQNICCTGDVDFEIFTPDLKSKIGSISKQWSGVGREWLTNANRFGVTFPVDLDVRVKAVLLGACFMIDFMFFENQNQG